MSRLFSPVVLAVMVVSTLTATGAAASGWGGGGRGEGVGVVSGFAVSAVRYELSAGDPGLVAAVSFALAPEPAVDATITAEIGGVKYACDIDGSRARCLPQDSPAVLAAIDSLRVVAAP